MKNHLQFKIQRREFIEIERICQDTCDTNFHSLKLSEKLLRVTGFENRNLEKIKDTVVGQRPADLISGLPSIIRVYSDICETYITGDVPTPLLRIVKCGSIEIKNFPTPMYIPLLSTSFQSITIDIKDQDGKPIAFDYGTVTVILHFKRTAGNFEATYDNQSGHDPFNNYITIDTSMQKGKGVGSFLKGICRSALPLVKKVVEASEPFSGVSRLRQDQSLEFRMTPTQP